MPTLRSRSSRALALLGLGLAACDGADDPALQASYTIRLQHAAVLRGGGEGAHLTGGSPVVRNSLGEYYAGRLTDPAKIAIYDRDGRFQRVLGRRGGGPGEFHGVARLFMAPGDSLFVVDVSNQVSVFSPEDRFVRSFRAPGSVFGMAFAPDGHLILTVHEPLSAPAIVLVDRNGREVRALGPPARNHRDRPRLVALADSGRVWAGFRNRYRVELLELSGRRRRTLTRRLSWLGPDAPPEEAPARGMLREYSYDPRSGSLRVLLYRVNPRFVPRTRGGAAGAEGRVVRLSADEVRERFDVHLEVMDARTGRLVAGEEMADRLIAGFLSPTEVYAHTETADGEVVVDVWRLELIDSYRSRR